MRSMDTDPEAERIQLQLLREAGVEKRLALALSLTQVTMELAKRAVRERYPDADEDELKVRFVAQVYGSELAEGFRQYLEQRHQRG
jgi:hypothetical protein